MKYKIIAFNEYGYKDYLAYKKEKGDPLYVKIWSFMTSPVRLQDHNFFSSTGDAITLRSLGKLSETESNPVQAYVKTQWRDYDNFSTDEKQAIKESFARLKFRTQEIDASFKKLIPNIMPRTYYRGIMSSSNLGVRMLSNAKEGEVVVPDYGYAFASTDREVADGYARGMYKPKNPKEHIFIEIKAPSGTRVSKNPFHLGEVVFPRKATFKVLKNIEEDGITKVTLQYILPKN